METTPFVAQAVRADHLPLGVTEDRETEALASGQSARVLLRIHRDREQAHTKLIEFLANRSETSEFGSAHHSPETAEEEKQHRTAFAHLAERNQLASMIRQAEVRRCFQFGKGRRCG